MKRAQELLQRLLEQGSRSRRHRCAQPMALSIRVERSLESRLLLSGVGGSTATSPSPIETTNSPSSSSVAGAAEQNASNSTGSSVESAVAQSGGTVLALAVSDAADGWPIVYSRDAVTNSAPVIPPLSAVGGGSGVILTEPKSQQPASRNPIPLPTLETHGTTLTTLAVTNQAPKTGSPRSDLVTVPRPFGTVAAAAVPNGQRAVSPFFPVEPSAVFFPDSPIWLELVGSEEPYTTTSVSHSEPTGSWEQLGSAWELRPGPGHPSSTRADDRLHDNNETADAQREPPVSLINLLAELDIHVGDRGTEWIRRGLRNHEDQSVGSSPDVVAESSEIVKHEPQNERERHVFSRLQLAADSFSQLILLSNSPPEYLHLSGIRQRLKFNCSPRGPPVSDRISTSEFRGLGGCQLEQLRYTIAPRGPSAVSTN